MRLTSVLILVCALALSWSNHALAYSPDNHEVLTIMAAKEWNAAHPDQLLSEADIQLLVDGNRHEDEKNKKQRASNWHFYKPHHTMNGLEKRTSARRMALLIRNLRRVQASNKRDSILYWTGAVMHHLQDLTNPAHVAPVYHGTGIKDQFDDLPIPDELPLPESAPSRALAFLDPVSLIRRTAQNTFSSIQEQYTVTVTKGKETFEETHDWESFYEIDRKNLFGKYGKLGKRRFSNRDNFGRTEIKKGGRLYQIDAAVYANYRNRLLAEAVSKSAMLIGLIQ